MVNAAPENGSEKVIILGSGPAGATAAIYAARAMLSPVMIAGLQPGGQLTITTDVENYPGFAEAIQGPWLMEQMQAQAEHVGTRLVQDIITAVDLAPPAVRTHWRFRHALSRRDADHRHRRPGQLAGPARRKRSSRASACRPAQRATASSFAARRVAVVGGGNTAVEEALFLTNFADHVTLIHRRAKLRADMTNQQGCRPSEDRSTHDAVVEEFSAARIRAA